MSVHKSVSVDFVFEICVVGLEILSSQLRNTSIALSLTGCVRRVDDIADFFVFFANVAICEWE